MLQSTTAYDRVLPRASLHYWVCGPLGSSREDSELEGTARGCWELQEAVGNCPETLGAAY
eukprot:14607265-Alexandrium_andersonii.AAC.1